MTGRDSLWTMTISSSGGFTFNEVWRSCFSRSVVTIKRDGTEQRKFRSQNGLTSSKVYAKRRSLAVDFSWKTDDVT